MLVIPRMTVIEVSIQASAKLAMIPQRTKRFQVQIKSHNSLLMNFPDVNQIIVFSEKYPYQDCVLRKTTHHTRETQSTHDSTRTGLNHMQPTVRKLASSLPSSAPLAKGVN